MMQLRCVLVSFVVAMFFASAYADSFSSHTTELVNYFNNVIRNFEKVVYGDDNRIFVDANDTSDFGILARSTLALIPREQIIFDEARQEAAIRYKYLFEDMQVCPDEPYAFDPTVAICSGFLVGEDLVATAAHCVRTQDECTKKISWVFDYQADAVSDGKMIRLPSENVYHCAEVVERKLNDHPKVKSDYAIVRIVPAVSRQNMAQRQPLKVRTSGKINDDAELVIIGYPSGLPMTYSDSAFIRDNTPYYYFVTNLDSFSGNSGSAVFNKQTGLVEGILVRGERDYLWDNEDNCYRVNRCQQNGCRGEDVSRITAINVIAPKGKASLPPMQGENLLK